MKVQRADNTNFQGYKFKSPYARRVFKLKLDRYPQETREYIQNYMQSFNDAPVDITINATKARTIVGEHILFATFSNNEKLVVEKSRTARASRLKEFISRCADQAGYNQLQKPKEKDGAQELLDLANKTLAILNKKG